MEFETTRVARAIQHQMRGLQHELRYRRIKRLPLEHSGTKPRILYLTAAYPTFSESYMHDEIDALRRDFDIKIVTLKKTSRPRLRAFEFTLVEYKAPCLVYAPFESVDLSFTHPAQVEFLNRMEEIIQDFRPDYLHAHYLGMGALAAELSQRHAIPFTVRTHSMDVLNEPPEKLASYSAALSASQFCKRVLAFDYSVERMAQAGLRKDLLRSCSPVLKYSVFSTVQPSAETNRVICCGPAVRKKQHRDVVELGKLLSDHVVHLYAEGPTLRATKSYNQQQGNPIEIKYADPELMPEVYGRYSWMVYPSDTVLNKVGLPLGIAEAMAVGLGVCWQRLPGREQEQLDFLGGAGYLYDSISEVPKLLSQQYPEEKKQAGFKAAARCDIEIHKHLLTEIWQNA